MVLKTDPISTAISLGKIGPPLREDMGMEVDLEHGINSIDPCRFPQEDGSRRLIGPHFRKAVI